MDIFLLVSSFLKHKFSFYGKQQMEKIERVENNINI